MTIRARIIGIGQRASGDDAVGLAVVAALRAQAPADVDVRALADPTEIVGLLSEETPLVVVDAMLGSPPGRVRTLDAGELERDPAASVSGHGMSLATSLALARAIHPKLAPLRIVAVTIAHPDRYAVALSPDVARAIPLAAEAALKAATS